MKSSDIVSSFIMESYQSANWYYIDWEKSKTISSIFSLRRISKKCYFSEHATSYDHDLYVDDPSKCIVTSNVSVSTNLKNSCKEKRSTHLI